MNLDRTFCTTDRCENWEYDRRLSYSVIRAAERVGKPIAMADFARTCQDVVPAQQENDNADSR